MDTTRQDVSLSPIQVNFLRSLNGNKLTLSVFVYMFDKFNEHIREMQHLGSSGGVRCGKGAAEPVFPAPFWRNG